MAAISIKQSPDPVSAAGRVDLQRHSVAGFFLDEVLYRQAPEVVDFMLATSVLDELSVPACTALCGPGSAALLKLVYSAHMFVTALDDKAATYRYHQLVKEVLQAELHGRDPARQRLLHTTAAAYLAEGGQVGLAARHLLAAGDPVAAFNLLSERVVGDYYLNPTVGSALDLDEVQPDLFAGNPDILVPLATELLLRGAFDKGSRALTLAQQAGVDPDRQPELAVKLAFANALISGATGQLGLVFAQRERAAIGVTSCRCRRMAFRARRRNHAVSRLGRQLHPGSRAARRRRFRRDESVGRSSAVSGRHQPGRPRRRCAPRGRGIVAALAGVGPAPGHRPSISTHLGYADSRVACSRAPRPRGR